MTLFLLVLLAALVFEFINGFHDTANAIATVVSTKVLTPREAIVWAAFWNLFGALMGTAVASTIGKGLVDTSFVTMGTVLAALLSAIVWGLFTWWLGLPSSSSHALVGGLCGAALGSAGASWSVLKWYFVDAQGHAGGLIPKIVIPMISSPLLGFIGGALLMYLLMIILRKTTPRVIGLIFGKAQLVSAGFMGYSHVSCHARQIAPKPTESAKKWPVAGRPRAETRVGSRGRVRAERVRGGHARRARRRDGPAADRPARDPRPALRRQGPLG